MCSDTTFVAGQSVTAVVHHMCSDTTFVAGQSVGGWSSLTSTDSLWVALRPVQTLRQVPQVLAVLLHHARAADAPAAQQNLITRLPLVLPSEPDHLSAQLVLFVSSVLSKERGREGEREREKKVHVLA